MRVAIICCLLLAWPAFAQNSAGPTLSQIRAKGSVECAVSSTTPGFGIIDSKGAFHGLDVDTCRAVAAAVFGDEAAANGVPRAKFVALNGAQRLPALQAGQVDLVIQTLTQTMTREAANGTLFAGVNFYDGQGFLVRLSSGVKRATDLAGATICVSAGSTSELNLADWARANNVTYQPVVFEQVQEGRDAYNKGRCDAYSTDASQLAGLRASFPNPAEHVILDDIISKEPHSPVVRHGDDQWFDIVRWTIFALLTAEELGITQANVESLLTSPNPEIRRLLGNAGDHGPMMGLDRRWAYNAIRAVGNYGEIFERNLGRGSQIGLERGLNGLWNRGGLMYPPPIR